MEQHGGLASGSRSLLKLGGGWKDALFVGIEKKSRPGFVLSIVEKLSVEVSDVGCGTSSQLEYSQGQEERAFRASVGQRK